MTTKEKAIELVETMCDNNTPEWDGLTLWEGKLCATKAADEVLGALNNEVIFVFTDFNWVLYWEQVKKEIEAL
jgi:hypothetical protein